MHLWLPRILLIIFCSVFFSCSESLPLVVSCDGTVVFDFQKEDEKPVQRLSVFASLTSDAHRGDAIIVKNEKSGLCWKSDSPMLLESGANQWAGYMNFLPPYNIAVPKGNYTVVYEDAAGKQSEGGFSISYDDRLLKSEPGKVLEILGRGVREKLAVYSQGGELLYFDRLKDEWKESPDLIWKVINDGDFYRYIYVLGSVTCLLPPVYKESPDKDKE